jgi:hypothetical protein
VDGMICYCFGHTAAEIRREVEATGASRVAASIAARVRRGECSCWRLHPRGTCCLGDVHRLVRGVLQRRLALSDRVAPGEAGRPCDGGGRGEDPSGEPTALDVATAKV